MRSFEFSSKFWLAHARVGAACFSLLAGGCTQYGKSPVPDRAVVGPATSMRAYLENFEPLPRPVNVAVYEFPDLTGQYRPGTTGTLGDYSKAVTQGGGTLLIDILRNVGHGKWFTIVERARLKNLQEERKLIEDAYTGSVEPKPKQPPRKQALPALKFADYIFEGGITGYDRSLVMGGAGASYLGISGNTNYTKDLVNITLRLVDVTSGEVVKSVNTSKTIYSISIAANVSRYVSSSLLGVDVGISGVEPGLLAVREAVELAVYEILQECVEQQTWCVAKNNSPSRLKIAHQSKRRLRSAPPLDLSTQKETRDPFAGT